LLVVLGLAGAGFLIFLLLGAGDASAATQDGNWSHDTGASAVSSTRQLPGTIADDLVARVASDLTVADKVTTAAVGSLTSTMDATTAVPAQPTVPRSSPPSPLRELMSGAQKSLATVIEPVIKTAASVPERVSVLTSDVTSAVTQPMLSNPVLRGVTNAPPARPLAAQPPASEPATVTIPDAPATEPDVAASAATPGLAHAVPPPASGSSAVGVQTVQTWAAPPDASPGTATTASSNVGRQPPGVPAPLPNDPQPPALPAPTTNVPNDAGTAGSGAQAQAAVAPGRLAVPRSTTCELAGGHDADRLPGTPSFQPPFSPD